MASNRPSNSPVSSNLRKRPEGSSFPRVRLAGDGGGASIDNANRLGARPGAFRKPVSRSAAERGAPSKRLRALVANQLSGRMSRPARPARQARPGVGTGTPGGSEPIELTERDIVEVLPGADTPPPVPAADSGTSDPRGPERTAIGDMLEKLDALDAQGMDHASVNVELKVAPVAMHPIGATTRELRSVVSKPEATWLSQDDLLEESAATVSPPAIPNDAVVSEPMPPGAYTPLPDSPPQLAASPKSVARETLQEAPITTAAVARAQELLANAEADSFGEAHLDALNFIMTNEDVLGDEHFLDLKYRALDLVDEVEDLSSDVSLPDAAALLLEAHLTNRNMNQLRDGSTKIATRGVVRESDGRAYVNGAKYAMVLRSPSFVDNKHSAAMALSVSASPKGIANYPEGILGFTRAQLAQRQFSDKQLPHEEPKPLIKDETVGSKGNTSDAKRAADTNRPYSPEHLAAIARVDRAAGTKYADADLAAQLKEQLKAQGFGEFDALSTRLAAEATEAFGAARVGLHQRAGAPREVAASALTAFGAAPWQKRVDSYANNQPTLADDNIRGVNGVEGVSESHIKPVASLQEEYAAQQSRSLGARVKRAAAAAKKGWKWMKQLATVK